MGIVTVGALVELLRLHGVSGVIGGAEMTWIVVGVTSLVTAVQRWTKTTRTEKGE